MSSLDTVRGLARQKKTNFSVFGTPQPFLWRKIVTRYYRTRFAQTFRHYLSVTIFSTHRDINR